MKIIKIVAMILKNKMKQSLRSAYHRTRCKNIITSFLSLAFPYLCTCLHWGITQLKAIFKYFCIHSQLCKERSGFTKLDHVLLTPGIAFDLIINYYSLDHNIIGSFDTQNSWEICWLKCDLGNYSELANMRNCLSFFSYNCIWRFDCGRNWNDD